MSRRCVVVSVEIEEVRRFSEADWGCFTGAERAQLEGRHVRSAAGLLAVKRALCALFEELDRTMTVEERDFELRCPPGDVPRVIRAKPLSFEAKSGKNDVSELSVSISHTRCKAYGLAVLESVRKTGADEG